MRGIHLQILNTVIKLHVTENVGKVIIWGVGRTCVEGNMWTTETGTERRLEKLA
jgi:hypothetical protein